MSKQQTIDATTVLPADNIVLPFAVKSLGIRGRVVRLGTVTNDIVQRHNYPASVSALLAEAIALTAMLGASLKFDGKFILQANTNGPVGMLVSEKPSTSPLAVTSSSAPHRSRLDPSIASTAGGGCPAARR